ncbi:MAG: phosphatase PAP2 family protein [Chloroflexi bacterium]|nr:phosphatase PAP2 family protein [Chloroflexota bacterium]
MDEAILLWLNGWVGRSTLLDGLMEVLVSDYLAPVLLSLALLALWFHGDSNADRLRNQLVSVVGAMSIGFSNLLILTLNSQFARDRPFVDLDVALHFYEPTDSSFPANVAAVGFAAATSVFLRHRRLGAALYAVATTWSVARVFAGVHYPSDILAGAAIGVAMAFAAVLVTRILLVLIRPSLRFARLLYMA